MIKTKLQKIMKSALKTSSEPMGFLSATLLSSDEKSVADRNPVAFVDELKKESRNQSR